MIHRDRLNTRQTYNSIDSNVDSDDIHLALLKMHNALRTHHYTYKSTFRHIKAFHPPVLDRMNSAELRSVKKWTG